MDNGWSGAGGTVRTPGSTVREDAGASGGPAIPAPAARSGATEAPRGGPGEPGPGSAGRDAPAPPQERGSTGPGNAMRPCSDRQQNGEGRRITRSMINNTASSSLSRDPDRSAGSTKSAGRNAPAPPQERDSTGPGNVMRPCSDRQQNGAAEEARRITRSMINNTASSSLPGDPDTSAGSTKGAGERTSEGVSSSSKKRKRMSARSYVKRFKIDEGANAADVVVASSDRVGKEISSSGHVADSNISELCEGSMSTEKNKRHATDAECNVSKSLVLGLHETSETRVNQCSAPFSEVQPRKPTDMCRQNIAAESTLPVKARDRPCALARQSCLSSLQSAPASLIHHEEIKSTFEDSETISVQKEDSASGHVVMPSDETDGNSNMCVACGTPGTLRSCDGKACQSRYHISCLDPSLEYLSPGIWFCTSCTKKRFQFGLHSIVDGIESVWDVREAEGMQNSKQYFVKYKNLAHVHNCWVPEGDINVMPGGPDLLSLFNKRNHTEKAIWKEEWTKPHRLLRKRLLMPPKLADDFFSSSGVEYSYCNLEWLVKWRGLGYDHATWELETLPCLCTPEADELKKNYQNRHEAAKQSSVRTKAKVKKSSFQKLQRLPDGCHPDFDNDHLCSTNHLREFWYKSYGAVLVDDKEFVIKTILFTMSILPDVSQPILIVTTPASLSLWEAQFNNLAPFINVVVYDGGKDKLKLIQDLEFYETGSCIMLQVLLSHADAILEDIEPISRIGWEAVIVDYYQKSTLQYLEQLKQLSTDFRMLLVSSPIKDNLPEYVKLLGFLSSGEQEDGVDTADALVLSEVNFKRHIAHERRADSLKILEHWVPAYISQLQLEIYCSILLSNSSVLQSKMKSDSSLCDIIMSLSKCCDHPYLVDKFLPNSSANNNDRTDTIDTRIQACGKLLLLQKMLKEIMKRRLRVIILFQSGLAGGNSMGDILEGVLYERFGPESYERVESGAPLADKDAAVNMFNDKTKGRFFFLIESRACLPSIKLSSVDAIIIYNSDCNPLNDLKALQRIKMESQFKYPAIFRLYTPFTMEEKQLVLAKHGVLIDNYKDMPHNSVHSLISWGASFLFSRLDELQHDNHASKSFESDTDFMDKVILEFLKKLATKVEDSTDINCTSISKANMSGEFYSRNITLIGESVAMPALDGEPSIFWLNLLDGKSPCWDNISKQAQSSHRMLQNIDEPAKVPAKESEEARRKRRKVDRITISSSKHSSDNHHDDMLPKNCTALSPPFQQLDDTQQKEGMKKLMTTPKNLHVQLKQELSKLLKVLQLPDNVRIMAKQIFEYSLNNHLVLPEPVGILHAFNIALCWHAASLLNYNVDHRESLALAEKGFNCEYNEALAGLIYNKLRALKEKVPNRAGETNINGQPVTVEVTQLSWQETCTNSVNDHIFQNKEMDLHGNFTNGAPQEVSSVAEQMTSEGQEPVQETRKEWHVPNDEPPNMIVEKSIDLVDNVFYLREKNILCKQQLEISGLMTHRQNNVIRLKEVCSLVLEHIRRSHIDEMTRSEKIKLTAQWFTMLTCAFLEHMKLQHDKLELLQFDTWSSERILKEKLHQVAKSGELDLDFDRDSALPDSKFVMEEFIHFKGHSDEYCVAENEPVETSMGSGGGLASEAVDFQHIILCSSDGIGVQRAGCSSSTIPANDNSTGQESSTSECRNTEHTEIYNTAKSIMLLGVNAHNDDTLYIDRVHMESPNLASLQSLVALVGTQAVLSCMSPQKSTDLSAQQNVTPSRCPPAEAEQTGLSGTHAVQVLQLEMQRSILCLDASPQKTHPNDRSQECCQPHKATGLSQGPSLDPHAGAESAGIVIAHDLQSEIQPSASVPAEQSTSLPAQQTLGTSQHRPAEEEHPGILGTEPACDLQPEVQPSTSVQDEPSEAEDEPEVEDEPAEAERAGTLGVIAVQEMQSSTSTQVVPFERTYLSGMSVLQSPTIHQRVEPSLDPHAGVESAGTVTTHDLQSEILPSASVPTEQSTNLPAELSLGTSRRSPAEAESADILGTEAACHLQPSQGEVQTSVTMQDQPAEGQACILGDIAARSLQPETQPSTSAQSAPFERTYLVGMPVLQNHSVEPSLDPHARAESTQTSVSLMAHHLESEVQPSASMQDRPAEAEGAVMLGSTAAQDLQPELQSSTTFQHVPLERTHFEERRQIGFQPNIVPGPEQPTERPPVTMLVFNNPIHSDEPLKNELDRLMQCDNVLRKDHEHKKSLLLIEYNQEIEKINKKYDSLLQKEDSTYLQNQRELADLYKKVFVNKALAENFRGEFIPSPAAQGRSTSPIMQQPCESSSAAQIAVAPVISSSAIGPQVYNPPGSHVRPSFVAQPSSSSQPQTILPGNLYGTTSSPSVPVPVPDGSYGSGGALSRAVQPQSSLPSNLHRTIPPIPPLHLPHASYESAAAQLRASPPLEQLRMPPPYAIRTDQQQLPASTTVTSLEQYAPVITGSYTSTVPPGVAVLNSMDPSSAHQTMLPSASSSCPPHRASSLPPSRRHLAVSIVNYLRSSSSNPIFMPAHQQSSYPSMVLGSPSGGLPNAAPGSQQHTGAQIAGVNHNQSGSESASLGPYMPARFGLGSSSGSPAGAGTASAEVVCLSDDE